MTVYDFTFVVDADPYAEDFEDRFVEAGCDDATFLLMKGSAALSFDREADNYKTAVLSAYKQIKDAGSSVVRFEPDFLVSPVDIAERANLTRSSINLYIRGERREGFPAPSVRVKSKNPLWDWVKVSRWLVENDMLRESAYSEAVISRIINATAQLNNVIPDADIDVERALEAV